MPNSEFNDDSLEQPDEKSDLEKDDFTPWIKEQSQSPATSRPRQSRVIKGRMVRIAEPAKITHEISLEPDPKPENVEINPLIEGDTIVGLLLKCSCGRTHEVRFDYGEEQ